MTTSDKIIFYGGGAWGQALAIALSNCNTKSSILVSDKKRMESLNNGITKLIKFVTKNLKNSLNPPSFAGNLKIILRERKYETITPIEKEKIFVK